MSLITQILDKEILTSREEEYLGKTKTSFWASETEVMAFEVYHRWIGTTPTNPMDEEKMMMLKMRKLTEEAIVNYLRKSGLLVEELSNNKRCYFEWGPNKIPISGYPDAAIMNPERLGKPSIVEIKTYYGQKNHAEVSRGKIKTSYLKQLAIYLYHFEIEHGILLMVNQGTGERFEYDLYQNPENKYHFICPDNETEINLLDTFKRFENIYVNHVLKKIEPPIEFTYKYPIESINWDELSSDKIVKARANRAVVGDWEVKYSDFKDLILERQNTTPGYTDSELKRIRELTTGYSAKRSGLIRFDPTKL